MNHRLLLTVSIGMALSACAGGGGTKSSPPPAPKPPVVVPPPPPAAPQVGWPSINQPSAAAEGLDGKGVLIGAVDTGINLAHPNLSNVPTQWVPYGSSTVAQDPPEGLNPGGADHGTLVALILVGQPSAAWGGGVAPGASLIMGRNPSMPTPQRMVAAGARVINFSFGDTFHIDAATREDYDRYFGFMPDILRDVKAGRALLVIAAGNEGGTSVTYLAGTSYFYPDLTNVLAVVALDPKTGELATYSNACGERAMTWCLAAPGTALLPNVTDVAGGPVGAQQSWQGTSIAAPLVSGTAALVAQRYPWMDGTQLGQTVLTTADDLGAPGVDVVYGHGRVNTGRAVHGPGAFDTTFRADVTGGRSVFSNPISGAGGLIKAGGGTLELSAANTYQGGTTVEAGTLAITGSVVGDVNVTGGTLQGQGQIDGNLQVAPGGRLEVSTSAPLSVSGTVEAAGPIALSAASSGYQTVWSGRVLSAGSIVGPTPDLFAKSPWLQARWSTDAQGGSADLIRRDARAVLATGDATQQASAARMEQAFAQLDQGQGSAAFRETAGALQNTQPLAAVVAADALSGQPHASVRDVALTTSDAMAPVLAARVSDVTRLNPPTGAWVTLAHPETRSDHPGYFALQTRSTWVMGGLDGTTDAGATVGVGAFQARDTARFDRGGATAEGARTGVFAYVQRPLERGQLQASVAVTHQRLTSARSLVVGPVVTQARARAGSTTVSWSLEAERSLSSSWSVAAVMRGDHLQAGSFREHADVPTGWELEAGRTRTDRVVAGPDARWHGAWGASDRRWSLDASLGYRRLLVVPDGSVSATYQGLPGTPLRIEGQPWSRNAWEWGATAGYTRGSHYWFVQAQGQAASHQRSTAWSLGWRTEF